MFSTKEQHTGTWIAPLRQSLGTLCEGDWVLLLEDIDDCPVGDRIWRACLSCFAYRRLSNSRARRSRAAGYEHTTAVTAKPWAA